MGQNLPEGEALAPGNLDHCIRGGEKGEQAGSCLNHPKQMCQARVPGENTDNKSTCYTCESLKGLTAVGLDLWVATPLKV